MPKNTFPFPTEAQQALIICKCHIGGHKVKQELEPYIFNLNKDSNTNHIFDIACQWEKLVLAARAIVAIENPKDVVVVSGKEGARKAVLRFCDYTGCTPQVGRFTPGSFTNQKISKTREPRLIVVSDPDFDKQTVREASYVGVPVIGFCNTDNNTEFVHLTIPMNNRATKSIGAGFCLLAKIVNYMRGDSVGLVDNLKTEIERYFYRNPEELNELAAKQQQAKDQEEEVFKQEQAVAE